MERSAQSFAQEFHSYYLKQARWPTALAFLFVGLNFLAGSLYSSPLLGLPREIPYQVLLTQWALIIPTCVIVTAALSFWRSSLRTEWLIIIGTLLVSLGVVFVRRGWQQTGVNFPIDFTIYFMALMAAVAGFGRRVWIAVLPVLTLNIVTAYALHGATPQAHMETMSILCTALVVGAISWQVRRMMYRMWQDRQHFESLSRTDSLTELLNRRAFEETAAILLAQARRSQKAITVAMLDIDFFKAYNDRYGHAVGDDALRQIAQDFSSHARRPLDVCARIGGEEFAIIWYDISEAQARQLCDNVLRSVRLLGIEHVAQPAGKTLTVSLGACHTPMTQEQELVTLLAEADRNLYLAKQRGRNRYELSGIDNAETDVSPAASASS